MPRRDPPSETGLFAAGPAAAVGGAGEIERFDLAAQLEGLELVHDEDGLEPLGEPRVPVDAVGVRSPLQQLYLNKHTNQNHVLFILKLNFQRV